ncbi:Putative Lipoate-protein ligase A [Klebsormidium nitens]|uniref:Putative Lipoate-protein ligase A n=1 Tax=Klebsormidium nitens TaxID=105231 RepID=A0A1Y1HZH6_KLENI|nr:Putative Lipoate-protein ligase A [Klebsormidium nitens]|eukprot:GAQ84080.1 Putative Lipoate-protein ligase A [Klebsormidium nitens]
MAEVRPLVNVVRLRGYSIFRMLQLEEALLRTDDRNWLLLNEGTEKPAIVMGISGKPPTLLNIPLVRKVGIPVIKRFTGGGTVVVDKDTLFATLLMKQDDMPDVRPYPRDIMAFMEAFYQHVFAKPGAEAFRLRENDFVFGNRKFGGNAQSITKLRWLHHTSFLWDYQDQNMDLLRHPDRAPDYRKGRAHGDFLCKLREHFETKGKFDGYATLR